MSNTPSKEEVRWCSACGEGVTFFCRSKIDCVCPQALVRPASSSTPSDTEIEALAEEYLQAFAQFPLSGKVWCEGEVEFARAVLAKWGAPQPVVLDDAELIRQMLEALENHDGNYKLSKSAGAAVNAAITAARARLEPKP